MNKWINLDQFTPYELIVTSIGWVFWITMYILIVRGIKKEKYVEMPWICVLGNIAWEGIWGFIFYEQINLGELFIWSYRAWFFMDIFIIWGVYKYGRKQIYIPELRKYFVPVCIFCLVMFSVLYYTFIDSGFDHRWGSQSAYISNVVISMLFITLFLKQWKAKKFSKVMAWCKCLGTFAYTIVYFNFDPPNSFVHTIGFVVLALDIIFISMLYKMQGKGWEAEEALPSAQ